LLNWSCSYLAHQEEENRDRNRIVPSPLLLLPMAKLLKLETSQGVRGDGQGGWRKMILGRSCTRFAKKKGCELLSSAAAAGAHNHGSWSSVPAWLEEEEGNLATQKHSEWPADMITHTLIRKYD
jgi:hypothetical protein